MFEYFRPKNVRDNYVFLAYVKLIPSPKAIEFEHFPLENTQNEKIQSIMLILSSFKILANMPIKQTTGQFQ
jgi:hypothetical protein